MSVIMKRKYLTGEEVRSLLRAINKDGGSYRDYCMVSMAFLHGLRVSELTGLKVTDYDPLSNRIHIKRLKGGLSTCHPLLPEENTMLECWMAARRTSRGGQTPWLFLSRQGKRISRQRFYQLLKEYGKKANLPLSVHPHMLRHACGYNLAERGNDTRLIQDYLGHRNIRHTVLYTAANAARFNGAWQKGNEGAPVSPLD
ncbi:tyrosine-type DNA invertase [Serratia bockelmannii]|uniref:tyrosine-type DNA invertase n=1 Tax=Serratia bockelmannii TaxID=2703793 RepID=UPI002240B79D|nr:tyrosine-type DNA invertase [Serratia bockelmannii]MCW7649157.1 tyrosine-type DNA invertase [Serratia bockelmannii]MCW7659208.1 tyrosine-type DNA invertase [Serratia bockelmannii]MCW7678992.1 tyrosine-type DNA invertase [Serratia bockelmannii]MCW7683769.1 tyrosine-type DNA invertase [Serratia bockelmannii]MCW7688546.1 tyrosine-type DNA invertase [Serratia bockelmannii]